MYICPNSEVEHQRHAGGNVGCMQKLQETEALSSKGVWRNASGFCGEGTGAWWLYIRISMANKVRPVSWFFCNLLGHNDAVVFAYLVNLSWMWELNKSFSVWIFQQPAQLSDMITNWIFFIKGNQPNWRWFLMALQSVSKEKTIALVQYKTEVRDQLKQFLTVVSII